MDGDGSNRRNVARKWREISRDVADVARDIARCRGCGARCSENVAKNGAKWRKDGVKWREMQRKWRKLTQYGILRVIDDVLRAATSDSAEWPTVWAKDGISHGVEFPGNRQSPETLSLSNFFPLLTHFSPLCWGAGSVKTKENK
jgi:hypothetical protein